MNKFFGFCVVALVLSLVSCAGERQGLVCEEIEYRLNTMTYSPDQRAYMEEELRTCRDEEAQKRGADAASRQSIYDRYAASDTTSGDSAREVSVSEALQDSSGVKTESIYDRYSNKNGESSPDTSADDASNFQ